MASTYQESVEQTITAGEQIHQIVNGTAATEVTVEDGSKVPSIRKALLDNFYFKDPISWQAGQTENVFNQLRKFTDGSWWYAPSATASNPISMGSTPVGDPLWKIYDFDAIGKLTPQLREALRRSYAEAGYNLVDGSFEAGGMLGNSNDVLLQESTGKAFLWQGALPKSVPTGSDPLTSGGLSPISGWRDASDLLLSGVAHTYQKYGSFSDGVKVTARNQGLLHSDGFYYVKSAGTLPFSVTPGSSPDATWSCVGLLNGYPIYSPESFGYRDGDDAAISFQLAMNAKPYNGKFELVDGSIYTLKTPVYIKKTGGYFGAGVHQNDSGIPVAQQHAQIIHAHNDPAFTIVPYWQVPVAELGEGGQFNRTIEGFSWYANRVLYPQAAFLTGQGSQTTTVIQGNYIRGSTHGICPLTSYGMLIQKNTFYDVINPVVANPLKYAPQGSADPLGTGQVLWQTNVIEIRNNIFDGYTAGDVAVDFNCPGNQITIEQNTIERFAIPVQVSSLLGYAVGDDGRELRAVTIHDNYWEASRYCHAVIGRSISGYSTADSAVRGVSCLRNTMNCAGIPDANAAVFILACTNGKFDNPSTGRPTSQLQYHLGGANLSSVEVSLYVNETTSGYAKTNSGNKILFVGDTSVRDATLNVLYINPSHSDAIPGGQELQWWSGVSNKPFSSYAGAITFLNAMREQYIKKGITTVELRCAGNIGVLSNHPDFLHMLTLAVSAGNPVITGMSLNGAKVHVTGAFEINNASNLGSTAPATLLKSNLSLEGCSFNYAGYPVGTALLYANLGSLISLVNCTAVAQLPVTSDRSIILMSSPGLTGTQTKVRGGQFFS